MEKKMQKPEMEIIHFNSADVIVASGGIPGQFENIDETE
ncbi:hypothetical protein SAMN05216469_10722 [Ruminococcus albus]|uniref:Uncharacterized protein n=1 Tax=Ruminococcus albus TaxID=1264 RepID=A0A1H7KM65_RUMAL|nr:hypothetical protein SAMN05216469_10722 [Ruminococcus albus]